MLAALAPRHRLVLERLAEGRTNAEIGASLHLAESTVKQYVSAMMVELGATNRVQLALLATAAR